MDGPDCSWGIRVMPKDRNFYLLVAVACMYNRRCILAARVVIGLDIAGIWTSLYLGNHNPKYLIWTS